MKHLLIFTLLQNQTKTIEMEKRIIKVLLVTSFLASLFYLGGSAAAASFDLSNWDPELRTLLVCFWLLFNVFALLAVSSDD